MPSCLAALADAFPTNLSVFCMTGSDEPDWPQIRRQYAAGALTLARIAERHGISVQRLARRARKEGWPARRRRPPGTGESPLRKAGGKAPTTAVRKGPRPRAAQSAPEGRRRETGATSLKARQALVRRLYKAIDTKLKQMERRMAHDMATNEGSSDRTAADHERDTRAIGALIANLSRVTEIEADLERLPESASPTDQHGDRQLADEAERFRREVAERLARLVRPA
ncbi:MAG: hypothetical protein ACK4TL_07220 [Hyphomicrobiaceae bacterium]